MKAAVFAGRSKPDAWRAFDMVLKLERMLRHESPFNHGFFPSGTS